MLYIIFLQHLAAHKTYLVSTLHSVLIFMVKQTERCILKCLLQQLRKQPFLSLIEYTFQAPINDHLLNYSHLGSLCPCVKFCIILVLIIITNIISRCNTDIFGQYLFYHWIMKMYKQYFQRIDS